MKPERKQLIEEWEAKLNEFASIGMENQLADENAAKSKKRAAIKKRSKSTRKAGNKKVELADEDDDLDFPQDDTQERHEPEIDGQLVDSDDEVDAALDTPRVRTEKQNLPRSTRKIKKVDRLESVSNKENNQSRSRRAKVVA